MSDNVLRMWTIYQHPNDYPDLYVARLFEVDGNGSRPTGSIVIAETLDRLREEMIHMGLTPINRSPEDDPVIVETWL